MVTGRAEGVARQWPWAVVAGSLSYEVHLAEAGTRVLGPSCLGRVLDPRGSPVAPRINSL